MKRYWLLWCGLFCLICASRGTGKEKKHSSAKGQNLSVALGEDGKLVYTPDEQGNVIPDFSNCGYHGGGVALPEPKQIPVRATVHASGGEDGPRIQAAIDEVSKLSPDANGVRGAVLLTRGEYHIAGAIAIRQGGVVLRGEGDEKDGTVLNATGTGRRSLISIGGNSEEPAAKKKSAAAASESDNGDDEPAETRPEPMAKQNIHDITDEYVPVGAHSFTVDDATGLKVGDHVIVRRPSTAEWIHTIGMDRIPPKKDGTTVQWTAGSKDLLFDRVITGLDGKRVTVDAPLTNALERRYGGGKTYLFKGREPIAESGVENLRGVSAFHGETDENHARVFINLEHLENGYVRNITAEHFVYSAVELSAGTKWVTVQDCACLDPISKIIGGRRYSFCMSKCSLCLVQRCTACNGRHDFVMGSTVAGPNVFLECRATKTHADSGPHHRWSTGTLWDNLDLPGGEINIRNRGNSGTGHGWAGANQVLWNCVARSMKIEDPPTAQNWAIGCKGKHEGNGRWESIGETVQPRSLYLAQLQDRLGPRAVANVTEGSQKRSAKPDTSN